MIRRPPRSTLSSSSAASDVYKRQLFRCVNGKTVIISYRRLVCDNLSGLNVMRWQRILPILCVLLLFSLATAGCTVSLNPSNVQVNPSQSPLGINSTGTSNGTAHMLSLIHISEPTRLLSNSYAVFCLKKKKNDNKKKT